MQNRFSYGIEQNQRFNEGFYVACNEYGLDSFITRALDKANERVC